MLNRVEVTESGISTHQEQLAEALSLYSRILFWEFRNTEKQQQVQFKHQV
jgi:hypothetical protein